MKHHPEILHAFEGGWAKLDLQSQDIWSKEGQTRPDPNDHDYEPSQWHSWAFVRYQQYQDMPKVQFECDDLHQELSDIVRHHMPHSGAIYGMPRQQLREREKSPVSGSEEDMEGEEHGEGEEDDNEGATKDSVADQAASAILNAEMPRFIERIRRQFDEKGLDAVYEWYPADTATQLE